MQKIQSALYSFNLTIFDLYLLSCGKNIILGLHSLGFEFFSQKDKEMKDDNSKKDKIDLKAAHKKAVMVMIGIFVALLLLMVLLSDHVEFASTGGM